MTLEMKPSITVDMYRFFYIIVAIVAVSLPGILQLANKLSYLLG